MQSGCNDTDVVNVKCIQCILMTLCKTLPLSMYELNEVKVTMWTKSLLPKPSIVVGSYCAVQERQRHNFISRVIYSQTQVDH